MSLSAPGVATAIRRTIVEIEGAPDPLAVDESGLWQQHQRTDHQLVKLASQTLVGQRMSTSLSRIRHIAEAYPSSYAIDRNLGMSYTSGYHQNATKASRNRSGSAGRHLFRPATVVHRRNQ